MATNPGKPDRAPSTMDTDQRAADVQPKQQVEPHTLSGRSSKAVMAHPGRMDVRLRPVREVDLEMCRRFLTEPGLIGNDWLGFRDAGQVARRFAEDGYLAADNGRLIVEITEGGQVESDAGFVTWGAGRYGGMADYWEIGIVLLPEFRGRGIGWRAQAMLADYLFRHTPAQRIQAGTQPENTAEQKSLLKAGFQREGVIRAAEFRDGQWRDGVLYSRLRDDPASDTTRP
jgi:RimJ/RimL family protein N-acetyltransferase